MWRFEEAAQEEAKTKFDDESMVASINRPTHVLYRKSKEGYDKTMYDKLMESRPPLSEGT